jgi:hypothetical protein
MEYTKKEMQTQCPNNRNAIVSLKKKQEERVATAHKST